MKTSRNILIAILAVFMAASCSLDEKNYTDIKKSAYMTDAKEANSVLLGVYRDMTADAMYGYHLSMYFTLPSDIAKIEGNSISNWRNVPCNSYTSTEDEVQGSWRSLYSAIYDANDFIERLAVKVDEYSDTDKRLAAVYMAEARCLRALYYFELVRWFGHVALITSTEESYDHPSTFVQAAPEEVYAYIEKDLKYAIDILPYATGDDIRKNNSFRFSKGAALGLLTKVYATWAGYPVLDASKWAAAAKTAEVLISSGRHGLLRDYEKLWYNSGSGIWDPTESLIEVSFYSPSITGNGSFDSSGRIGKWNGVSIADGASTSGRAAANWRAVPSFGQHWKDYAMDKRWGISLADYKYTKNGKEPILKDHTFADAVADDAQAGYRSAFNNGLYPGKWDINKYVAASNVLVDANMSNVNWYILRYADVLLLYAEALNEWHGSPTDNAYAAVNMVRRRGFGLEMNTASTTADLPGGLTFEEFRQAVRDERAYELAFEGHRRQDLIRWGIYYETIMKTYQQLAQWHESAPNYYICADFTEKGKHELLPIPQRDKDLMPLFKQNHLW